MILDSTKISFFLWGPSGFLKSSNYLLTQRLYICDASPWLLNRFTNSSCFAYSIFEPSFDAKVLVGFTMLLVTKQFKQRSRFFYGILPFSFSLVFLFLLLIFISFSFCFISLRCHLSLGFGRESNGCLVSQLSLQVVPA